MAVFQLEIADEDIQRVFDAVCGNYKRPSQINNPDWVVTYEFDEEGNHVLDENGVPVEIETVDEEGNAVPRTVDNPESQGDFTHKMVRSFLSDHVSSWEREQIRVASYAELNTTVTLSDPDPDPA